MNRLVTIRTVAHMALALAACGGPGGRPAEGPDQLDRTDLQTLAGKEWSGDSVPVAGATGTQGWVVALPEGSNPMFGMAVYTVGDRRVALFDREVGRNGPHAVWRTLDAIRLPALPADHVVAAPCQVNDRDDPEIFAIVKLTEAEWLREVLVAWRANRAIGRLESIPTTGVVCYNEGAGV